MIFDEDSDPRVKKRRPLPLDNLSVPELKEYVDQLRQEIMRVEENIEKKEKHAKAAAALFKS